MKLAKKLQNPFRGPFKMFACKNERTCVIERAGKLEEFNVNRLMKQVPWDENLLDTSGIFGKLTTAPIDPKPAIIPLAPKDWTPQVGQAIIFGFEMSASHRSPFGVGIIMEIENTFYSNG